VWPRGFQEVYASRFSWHSALEDGKVVTLTHRPPLPPGMFLVLIFTRDWIDPRAMVRSEGNMSLKNPVTRPGIDPGTVRLVAQRLFHYATPGPSYSQLCLTIWIHLVDSVCSKQALRSCRNGVSCTFMADTRWHGNSKILNCICSKNLEMCRISWFWVRIWM
jgi:hypothetical protein